jgi:SAM-dependent methyltransferase
MNEPWYVRSFQDDYLKIYQHRTDEAAQQEVEAIVSLLKMKTNSTVLDLCCGNGRHSRELSNLGFEVTGIDLSEVLLAGARNKMSTHEIKYIQSDVRELSFVEEFEYVLNLFTSFGYFDEIEENIRVFQTIYNALKKNGIFLIDFLNPGYIRQNLVPYSERKVNDLTIVETRKIIGKKVLKDIIIKQDGKIDRKYEEQVNLFEFEEMKKMLNQTNLQVTNVYGDLNESPYDQVNSPRMIIIGKK